MNDRFTHFDWRVHTSPPLICKDAQVDHQGTDYSKLHQRMAIEHVVSHNIVNLQVVDCWPNSLHHTPQVLITQAMDEFQFEHLEPKQLGIGWQRAVGHRPEDVGVYEADVQVKGTSTNVG